MTEVDQKTPLRTLFDEMGPGHVGTWDVANLSPRLNYVLGSSRLNIPDDFVDLFPKKGGVKFEA